MLALNFELRLAFIIQRIFPNIEDTISTFVPDKKLKEFFCRNCKQRIIFKKFKIMYMYLYTIYHKSLELLDQIISTKAQNHNLREENEKTILLFIQGYIFHFVGGFIFGLSLISLCLFIYHLS